MTADQVVLKEAEEWKFEEQFQRVPSWDESQKLFQEKKHTLVLFDASWCRSKCQQAAMALKPLLASRNDIQLLHLDVEKDFDDEDDVLELGVKELPYLQYYQFDKLLDGYQIGGQQDHSIIVKGLVKYIGWHNAVPPQDTSNSTNNTTNQVNYTRLYQTIDTLTQTETDFIANCANTAAAIWHAFAAADKVINWCGFYLNRPVGTAESTAERLLVLGPFMGKPACKRIQFHSGVCGTAATTRSIQIVSSVNDFPGHIACDSASQSEIVIPMLYEDELFGVLDLDCPHLNGFSQDDADGLAKIINLVVQRCEWSSMTLPVQKL